MFGWPRKLWWLCLIDFQNFSTVNVFEIKESNADIPTGLPCLGDLENPGQFPVQKVLEGTDDCVLQIFKMF